MAVVLCANRCAGTYRRDGGVWVSTVIENIRDIIFYALDEKGYTVEAFGSILFVDDDQRQQVIIELRE